jgi:hypothetical protein
LGAIISIGATSCELPGATSGASFGNTASNQLNSVSQELALQPVSAQQVNLGSTISVPVTIQSQNGYAGMVNLSIDNKALAANDPMDTISVSVMPSSVDLSSGESAQVTVSVTTLSNAPDLVSSINLIAATASGQVVSAIPLQVMAIFEVDILGPQGASENWSVAAGSTVKFTQHKNGIRVNFVNKYAGQASGTVRIHSSATAFQHQGGEGLGLPGQTMTPTATQGATGSAAASVTAGDTYSVMITSQSSQLKDTAYDHNHENGGTAGRNFVFNAYSAPATIGNSGNPNASYAYIKANVVTPMCATCHVASQLGGVDLSSYASTLNYLQKGSASGSSLYVSIAPGGSMPQGNPGSVSAALVKDVQDWIDDGALNN